MNQNNDGKWDHNVAPPNGNGGLTAFGTPGGTSFYSNDSVVPAPMLTTTATGLDPWLIYNVYLAYYSTGSGVNAALSGQTLSTYLNNYTIDTGVFGATPGTGTVKLALLGQVSRLSSVAIDVGSTGNSYWDGMVLDVAGVVVPEPSTMALAVMGLFGLAVCIWRRRR